MPPETNPLIQVPHPALRRLDVLLGVWQLTGRTSGASIDDVTGRTTFEWLPGGFFLKVSGEITVADFHVEALELIGYDPASDTFPAQVYSNFSGEVSPYHWDVRGRVVTHWMATSKFTGALSPDGRSLTGGWRPTVATDDPGANYDAVMTRLA